MSGWADAIQAVYVELAPLQTDRIKVYPFEPAGTSGWQRPLAVTVALGPLTPTEYGVTVRCYASTTTDVQAAQTDLTDLVMAAEDILDATTGRTTWQTLWMAAEDAWVSWTVLSVGREDF